MYMWRQQLNPNENYVLDFHQNHDGLRSVVPRRAVEPPHENCRFTSIAYSGQDLIGWQTTGELGSRVALATGEKMQFGAHGDWLTEQEFVAWREHLQRSANNIRRG